MINKKEGIATSDRFYEVLIFNESFRDCVYTIRKKLKSTEYKVNLCPLVFSLLIIFSISQQWHKVPFLSHLYV